MRECYFIVFCETGECTWRYPQRLKSRDTAILYGGRHIGEYHEDAEEYLFRVQMIRPPQAGAEDEKS